MYLVTISFGFHLYQCIFEDTWTIEQDSLFTDDKMVDKYEYTSASEGSQPSTPWRSTTPLRLEIILPISVNTSTLSAAGQLNSICTSSFTVTQQEFPISIDYSTLFSFPSPSAITIFPLMWISPPLPLASTMFPLLLIIPFLSLLSSTTHSLPLTVPPLLLLSSTIFPLMLTTPLLLLLSSMLCPFL